MPALILSLLLLARAGQAEDFTLGIDPRVELLSMVQALATRQARPRYGAEAAARFKPWEDHAAVRRYARWQAKGVPGMSVMELMLRLSPPPGLAARGLDAGGFTGRLGGPEEVEAFLRELREFSARAGFPAFHARRRRRHDALVSAARAELSLGVDPRAMSAYLGAPFPEKLTILIAPHFDGGRYRLAMFSSSGTIVEARFRSRSGSFRLGDFGSSVAHELAHGVTRRWRAATPARWRASRGRRRRAATP